MGLFDTFKKLFHHSIDNTSAAEQTLSRGNDSPVKITFSRDPPTDSPSPDIVSLSVRLKKAVPTMRGLYPHEILMLEYAHTYSTDLSHQHFQGFWYYEYSVEHPGDVVKSLEKRGFIQPGNLRSAIQNQTVPVIKNELRAIGQKVSGKKSDLIDRLLSNTSPEELEKKFPVRFYELTESGTQELTENQYVPYLHRHKYMAITTRRQPSPGLQRMSRIRLSSFIADRLPSDMPSSFVTRCMSISAATAWPRRLSTSCSALRRMGTRKFSTMPFCRLSRR